MPAHLNMTATPTRDPDRAAKSTVPVELQHVSGSQPAKELILSSNSTGATRRTLPDLTLGYRSINPRGNLDVWLAKVIPACGAM
jgi:hypothetical protein